MNRKSFVLSLLSVIAVLMTSCGTAVTQTPSAAQPATEAPSAVPSTPAPLVLKIANTANVTTWDPVLSFSTEAAYTANVYEQLLRINPPGSAQKFTPLLAESWDTSADGLTWTFHLRKGVKFHDEEPMNAAAVKKSIEAAQDRAGASFIWAPLSSIDVVDDNTVKFTLSYAAPLDLIASSLYGAWIVSPKALDAVTADPKYYDSGMDGGTGPYTIESYTPDQQIVFARFNDYWGGWKPGQYDKVLVSIVPEATTQEQMLSGGQVDLAERVHRNQPLLALSKMAFEIIQVVMQRVGETRQIELVNELSKSMKLIRYARDEFQLDVADIRARERPPMIAIPEYRQKRGLPM